jgi:hypothetical protein
MENDRLIRLRSVGEMYGGISVKTVRRKIAAQELPPARLRRPDSNALLVGSDRCN